MARPGRRRGQCIICCPSVMGCGTRVPGLLAACMARSHWLPICLYSCCRAMRKIQRQMQEDEARVLEARRGTGGGAPLQLAAVLLACCLGLRSSVLAGVTGGGWGAAAKSGNDPGCTSEQHRA